MQCRDVPGAARYATFLGSRWKYRTPIIDEWMVCVFFDDTFDAPMSYLTHLLDIYREWMDSCDGTLV
jgi:hypothetical protein